MSASSDQVAVKVDQADLGGDGKKFTVAEAAPTPGGPTPSGARRTVFKFDRNPSGLLMVNILLNPFVILLWVLDFVVWLVLFLLTFFPLLKFVKHWCGGVRSHASIGSDGETFRTLLPAAEMINFPFGEKYDTVHKVAQKAFEAYASLPCMGTRKFIKMHKPEGAKFPLKVFGDSSWVTYADVKNRACAFGKGLRGLGLVAPMPLELAQKVVSEFGQITGPHTLLIFEETCADWLTACVGCMGQSVTVATSYATLGMPAVAEALNQTGAPVILCNYKDVEKVAALAGECPALKAVIYTMNCVEEGAPAKPEFIADLRVMSMDAVVASAGSTTDNDYSPPTAEHVGLIMYTSGSTGKPKGVMLKHSAIVAAVAGIENWASSNGLSGRATSTDDQETYLAYLPAAHILEFAAEMSMLAHGACLGYADPKTLSSTGAIRQLPDGSFNREPTGYGEMPPGAIQEFAPTIMAAVPKIWDIFKKGMEAKVGATKPIVQGLMNLIFVMRSMALSQGRDTPLLKLLFKKKFYAMLGGRMKIGITGGGPISSEVQNWVRTALCFNLVQGYALTETCSAGTIQPIDSVLDGVAGAPVGCVQMRVADCSEVMDREMKPYLSTDTRHYGTPCLGRGEVWIKGMCVSSGYYMQQDKTAEEFDAKGWFHTGDIAIWLPNGMLKIVDRKKNLVKLKGGEYVAIESMEATYAESVFVNGLNGGIMCYADGDMDRPVAMVQVNDYELKKWADSKRISYSSVEELCKNPEAAAMVTKDLNGIGKGKLGGNEALASVCLLPGTGQLTDTGATAPWTPDNLYLTASNKLNRKPIEMGFADELKAVKQKGIR